VAKLRKYRISGDLLVYGLRDGNEIHLRVKLGLPADAVIRGASSVDGDPDWITLLVESDTFDEVPPWDDLPLGKIVLESIEEVEQGGTK
jgi:hypothetical protein